MTKKGFESKQFTMRYDRITEVKRIENRKMVIFFMQLTQKQKTNVWKINPDIFILDNAKEYLHLEEMFDDIAAHDIVLSKEDVNIITKWHERSLNRYVKESETGKVKPVIKKSYAFRRYVCPSDVRKESFKNRSVLFIYAKLKSRTIENIKTIIPDALIVDNLKQMNWSTLPQFKRKINDIVKEKGVKFSLTDAEAKEMGNRIIEWRIKENFVLKDGDDTDNDPYIEKAINTKIVIPTCTGKLIPTVKTSSSSAFDVKKEIEMQERAERIFTARKPISEPVEEETVSIIDEYTTATEDKETIALQKEIIENQKEMIQSLEETINQLKEHTTRKTEPIITHESKYDFYLYIGVNHNAYPLYDFHIYEMGLNNKMIPVAKFQAPFGAVSLVAEEYKRLCVINTDDYIVTKK